MHSDGTPDVASGPAGAGPQIEGEHGDGGEDHVHLPPPTIWPMTMAGGVALAGMGLLTIWPLALLGGLIMAVALVSWIQELRHEQQSKQSH
jgi:Cytochrome c oxidase subunit IV